MCNSYRITKYQCGGGAVGLSSSEDEWISYFDVGAKVVLEDYLVVEGQYVDFVRRVCETLCVELLEIRALETFAEETKYEDGQRVDLASALDVVRETLREELWCKLCSEKVEFHFGYDFYMYVICPLEPSELLIRVPTELNVEVFQSPYL